tara:strand:- start:488 stop:733 length:246 start_codon:yes stop_codon:yes gene_type:complete
MNIGLIVGYKEETQGSTECALIYNKDTNEVFSPIFNSKEEAIAFIHYMEEAGLRPLVETIKEDPEVVAEYLFLFRHNDGCD